MVIAVVLTFFNCAGVSGVALLTSALSFYTYSVRRAGTSNFLAADSSIAFIADYFSVNKLSIHDFTIFTESPSPSLITRAFSFMADSIEVTVIIASL